MNTESRVGYCCLNLSTNLRVNRGMVKRTFQAKGINYASELAEKNLQDLVEILKWNAENNIYVYRMSSNMFPWMSEYEIESMPNYGKLLSICKTIGNFAKEHNMRLSFHPGHFVVLGSPNKTIVENSIKELEQHSQIMDMMELSATPYNAINIHINGVYGNKAETAQRFLEAFYRLSDNCRNRVTLENDDKPGQWSVVDLHHYISSHYLKTPPIVFDYLHHKCCNNTNISESAALAIAIETWPEGVKPLTHYSSSAQTENAEDMFRKHSYWLHEDINTWGNDIDIELEVKGKDLALLEWRKKFQKSEKKL